MLATHTHTMDSGYNIHHIILRHHPWASVGYHHGEPESVENDSWVIVLLLAPGIGSCSISSSGRITGSNGLSPDAPISVS